jgi:hypothetical protein
MKIRHLAAASAIALSIASAPLRNAATRPNREVRQAHCLDRALEDGSKQGRLMSAEKIIAGVDGARDRLADAGYCVQVLLTKNEETVEQQVSDDRLRGCI